MRWEREQRSGRAKLDDANYRVAVSCPRIRSPDLFFSDLVFPPLAATAPRVSTLLRL